MKERKGRITITNAITIVFIHIPWEVVLWEDEPDDCDAFCEAVTPGHAVSCSQGEAFSSEITETFSSFNPGVPFATVDMVPSKCISVHKAR